jgi:tetratricopeptide (TPR) repeat protein
MLIPDFRRVQAPPRFAVEVKGISYERILSLARDVLGTETTITGNLVLNEDKFILIARAPDAGPWESVLSPISAEGLKQASRDLAEKILTTGDPTAAGVAMLKDGRVDEGLDLLNRARSLNPSDERLKLNLCMGFAASRRYNEAIDCYRELLNKNSNPTQEMSEGLAQALFLIGDRQAAIDIYENLIHRGFKTALLGLGEALDNNDRHIEAIMKYDEFLSGQHYDDRYLAIAHVKRGVALSHLGRHTEALAEYQRALKYAPRDVLVLVSQGVELAQTGDLDTGIAQLKSVVDENQDSHFLPFACLQLGSLLEKKGDWRGAIGEYEKAAQLRPTYVEAYLKLAHALVHEGDRAKAFNQYKKVAKLSPSDLERRYSDIFANQWLGNALRDQADYSGAMEAYQTAILLKPDFSAAHCQLGLILSRQGNRRLSIQHLQAALVPPKSRELSDHDCILIAQRLLAESAPLR